MYYYILDSSRPEFSKMIVQQRKLLQRLGVAGEFVHVDLSKSVDDLVKRAISEDYSTIVAIGSDGHINRVAKKLFRADQAFGIIPLEKNSSYFEIINARDAEEAAEILRFRRLTDRSVITLGPEAVALNRAILLNPKRELVLIRTKEYELRTRPESLSLSNPPDSSQAGGFVLEFLDRPREGIFKKIVSFISDQKGARPDNALSQIVESRAEILSLSKLDLLIDGQTTVRLPVECKIVPRAIRLIVGKRVLSSSA